MASSARVSHGHWWQQKTLLPPDYCGWGHQERVAADSVCIGQLWSGRGRAVGLLAGRPACQTDPQIILDFSPTQKAQLRTNQVHIHAQNTKFALQTPQMGLSSEQWAHQLVAVAKPPTSDASPNDLPQRRHLSWLFFLWLCVARCSTRSGLGLGRRQAAVAYMTLMARPGKG